MAELILTPIVDLMIETLGSSAVEEIKSLQGVKGELRELENTLESIRAVLVDAEKRQIHEEHVRVWLERLEAVFYDADDLVDEVGTEGLRRQLIPGRKMGKKVRTFFSSDNQLVFQHKMASRIKDIRTALAVIAADRVGLHLAECREEIKSVRRERETGPFVVEENVVGRVSDKLAILELLLAAENQSSHDGLEKVSVIPIVGMGGLGKTTLAQLLFADERVQQHFELRIWVCVSDNFDEKLLVEKIIESITNKMTENLRLEQLQEILLDELNGKRYLLVLDDVWNEDPRKWQDLKGLLTSKCAEGSRIIVTSRNEMVAMLMGTVQPYRLGILGPDHSWALFKKMAFFNGQQPTNPTVVNIAKKILKKCGGVPLAITMIGSMLRFRDLETDWSSFLEKDFSILSQDECGILPTLRLSYLYLPSHLKPCFVYCRLFPKDYIINVKKLINLWIAQGFIKSNRSQSLEEIGYEYCMDLLWRSFFQEVKRDKFNKVKTCKIHDLNHDLATQIAGNKYATFVFGEQSNFEKVRHLSFGFCFHSPEGLPSCVLQAKRLRTILWPVGQKSNDPEGRKGGLICDAIVSNFKFLRLLDLNNLGIEAVPDSIGKLKHLRYLDLSKNKIETLPTSVTKLVNLQTLKLNWCSRLHELPREINKLVNLRHLEFSGRNQITSMPRGLSQLTNLQSLTEFVLSDAMEAGQLEELKGLNNLSGELKIRGLRSWMDIKAANLKQKQHLLSLHLDWCHSDGGVPLSIGAPETTADDLQLHPNLRELTLLGYQGFGLSSWLPFLTNLVELCLRNCMKCEQLPSLDQFFSLKKMELTNLPALKYITSDENGGYSCTSSSQTASTLPSLQQLKLNKLPNFEGWQRPGFTENQEQQVMLLSFPCLSKMEIKDCPKLTSMPLCENVEELSLENTSLRPFVQTFFSTKRAQTSTTSTSSSPSTICPLFKLRELRLCGIIDPCLQHLSNWMKSFFALKKLCIRDCPKLGHLSPGIQHLTSLETLSILYCEELEISDDVVDNWQALASLRTLALCGLPRLITLPMWVKHITTLQVLALSYCDNLIAIPDWICSLCSLKTLEIRYCPNLKSLPGSISSLTSLTHLLIEGCPTLLERCKHHTGGDWPMIAHVPHVLLSFENAVEVPGSEAYLIIDPKDLNEGQYIYHVPPGSFYPRDPVMTEEVTVMFQESPEAFW